MKIILSGASGAMGKTIASLAEENKDFEIVLGYADHETEQKSFPIKSSLPEEKIADVLIDFSLPAALGPILDYGKKTSTPLVLCATGYTDEEEARIKEASKEVPILKSGNMSAGINMMEKLVETVSRALADFDIEIVESHHKYKADSPSGTAKMLFEAANKGRASGLHELEGRAGHYDSRDEKEVGISSVRGGSVVGEHSVYFLGQDEILEIKHSAGSKKIFGLGAIKAGRFLKNKDPGFYTMGDVLND